MRGLFGLVPFWSADLKLAKRTYNARSETAAEKPSFREAWRQGQHCIVPAASFFVPDWRSGKAVATRISRTDGQPMGIAGLWSGWMSPHGELVHSFTMLTINAETHSLMRQFHKPAGRGRDGGHPPPPAQIRTCRITAYGSCLRYVTHRSAPRDKGAYCGRSE